MIYGPHNELPSKLSMINMVQNRSFRILINRMGIAKFNLLSLLCKNQIRQFGNIEIRSTCKAVMCGKRNVNARL